MAEKIQMDILGALRLIKRSLDIGNAANAYEILIDVIEQIEDSRDQRYDAVPSPETVTKASDLLNKPASD